MTRMKRLLRGALVAGVASLMTACGCDDLGYFAIELELRDANSGAAVPVAGATLTTANRVGPPLTRVLDSVSVGSASTSRLCCSAGPWTLAVIKPGYARFDTSLVVPSEGRCEKPVLQRVVARLRPLVALGRTRAMRDRA